MFVFWQYSCLFSLILAIFSAPKNVIFHYNFVLVGSGDLFYGICCTEIALRDLRTGFGLRNLLYGICFTGFHLQYFLYGICFTGFAVRDLLYGICFRDFALINLLYVFCFKGFSLRD